jgi:hypothetical protein
MTQHGFTLDLEEKVGVSGAVGGDGGTRENGIGFRMFGAEDLGCFVAVYKDGFTSCFGDFEAVLNQLVAEAFKRRWKREYEEL